MSKLALVVLLFIILIKAAFGADIGQFKKDQVLDGKITAVLTAAKAAADRSAALQDPWKDSAAQYAAELKKEIDIFSGNADNKFLITSEYLESLSISSKELGDYIAADAAVLIISGLKDADDEDLMYLVLKLKASAQSDAASAEDFGALIVKSLQERETFKAEDEFKKPESKAKYISLITNLKKFNAETALARKGGPKEYVAFAKKAVEIFF